MKLSKSLMAQIRKKCSAAGKDAKNEVVTMIAEMEEHRKTGLKIITKNKNALFIYRTIYGYAVYITERVLVDAEIVKRKD